MANKQRQKKKQGLKIVTVSKRMLTDSAIESHRYAQEGELRIEMTEPGGLRCHIGKRKKTFFLRFAGKPYWVGEFDAKGVFGLNTLSAQIKAKEMQRELLLGNAVQAKGIERRAGCQTLKYAWNLYIKVPEHLGLAESTKVNERAAWKRIEVAVGGKPLATLDAGDLKAVCDAAYVDGEGQQYGAAENVRLLLRKLYSVAKLHRSKYPATDFSTADDLKPYKRPAGLPAKFKNLPLEQVGPLFRTLMDPQSPMPNYFRGALLLQLSGGMRGSDAAGIHRGEIDEVNNVWRPIDEPGRVKVVNDHYLYLTKTIKYALSLGAPDGARLFPAPTDPAKFAGDDYFDRCFENAEREGWFPEEVRVFFRHDLRKTVVSGLAEVQMAKELGIPDGFRQRFVGQKDTQANGMDSIYNGYRYYIELRDVAIFWERALHELAGLEPPVYTKEELVLDRSYERLVRAAREKTRIEKPQPTQKVVALPKPKAKTVSKLQALSVEELARLVWTAPLVQLAKGLKCSDNAIRNRCNRDEVKLPEQGFWNRVAAGHPESVSRVRQ